MPIDTTKDIKPLIKLDWTKQKDSIGFFQKAEGDLPDRYSITVTTNDTTTDGSDDRLEDIKENAVPTGFENLLYFYEKSDDANNSRVDTAFAEDWFLSERPLSPIKVLVSIPSIIIDQELTDIPEAETLPTPSSEIYFNTFEIEKKFNGVLELLNRYTASIRKFKGKVQGLDLVYEVNNLSNFISVLSALMRANGHMFSNSRSDMIVFGIDSQYKFLYAQINDGSGFKTLFKSFNKFVKSPVATNQRTVNFLTNFEEMHQIYFKNEKMPMQQFFDEFVLNPPSYEMSEAPRKSPTKPNTWEEYKARLSKHYTDLDLDDFLALKNTPEQREELQDKLDSSANFVGDHVISKLDTIGEYLEMGTSVLGTNPTDYISDGVFKQLLNKVPLQSLIAGAMECIGFRGFEFLDRAKALLGQTDSFFDNVSVLLQKQLPTISVPDDFPVVDYMKDLGLQILNGILDAVVNVLIQMLVELIRQLLDACKECALAQEDRDNRNDAMNFGAFDVQDSLLRDLIVGTVSDISSGYYEGTGADQVAAEVIAEGKQHAKNPFLLANHIDEDLGEALGYKKTKALTQQEIEQKIENAKTDFTGYIRASSTILTPGEAGNLLLGCPVGREATYGLTALLNNYPNLKRLMQGDGDPSSLPKQIRKLWEDLGKLIGNSAVLEQIKNITDAMPESAKCLQDADDLAIRTKLLNDKGLSSAQIADQITKSNDRRQQRLEDLSTMLEQGNPLKHALPEIYCTVIYRDPAGIIVPKEVTMPNPLNSKEIISRKTGEVLVPEVKKGLIEKDHPSLTFLMNQVLDTIYDSLTMTFNQDMDGFIPNLTKNTFIEREVPRTIVIDDNGTSKLELNPEWTKLVKDPSLNYSYGALPGDAAVPGRSLVSYREDGETDEVMIIENAIGGIDNDDVEYYNRDARLNWGSPVKIRDRLVAGQMQTGQTTPTAEQEAAWEQAQTLPSTDSSRRLTIGGRKRPQEYGPGAADQRVAEYSRLYGYSPIPITVKEKGKSKFSPGLQESFSSMCADEKLFDIHDRQATYHIYNFQINNNVFDAAGVGNEVQKILGNSAPSPQLPTPPLPSTGTPAHGGALSDNATEMIAKAFSALAGSTYNIDYIVPYSASIDVSCGSGWPINSYATTITLALEAPMAGSVVTPPLIIYQDVENKKQEDYVCSARQLNGWAYDANLEHIPQEQAFVTWNQKVWSHGTTTYRSSYKIVDELRETVANVDLSRGITGIPTGGREGLKNFLYAKDYGSPTSPHSTYDGLWRDFYCSFTKMISKSPLLDLGKLNGLDLLPMNKAGQDPNCDPNPSLLDTEAIKQRIRDEYGVVQCIEASFPNIDGLGSNKDNPFEKANLGGAVLLTVRTYVLEVMLRSLFVFYYFRFNSPDTVDGLLVNYISQLLVKDVTQKEFIDEFRKEALDLYNRNAPSLRPPRSQTDDFDKVLDYFIRYQVYAVSNRLTKMIGTIGDTSLDSYLLIDQSSEDPSWIPGCDVPAFPNDPNRILKNDSLFTSTQAPTPIPTEKVKELLGDGALSQQTLRKFNWDSSISYLKNLPIGMLFREYFGKTSTQKQTIWSKESSISTAVNPESWRWITGAEPLSPNKRSGPFNREEQIFADSGITALNQFTTAGRNTILGLDAPQNEPTLYNFGVSDSEKKVMSVLLKMLAAGTSINARESLVMDYALFSGERPGKLFSDSTAAFTSRKSFKFKYNYVWDRHNWGDSGIEPPPWITGKGLLSPPFGPYTIYAGARQPTDSMSLSDNGSSKNRTYYQGYWYPEWTGSQLAAGGGYAPQVRKYRSSSRAEWRGFWNPTTGLRAYNNRAEFEAEFLRWITIDGVEVGPWRGTPLSSGKIGWKLIDPTWGYDAGGQPMPSRRSWSDTINRTNTPFDSQTHAALSGDGLTVGVDSRQPSFYGLSAASNPNTNPYSYRLFRRASNLLGEGMPYVSLLDFDILTIIELLKWEKTQAPGGVMFKYQEWIDELEEAVDDFKKAFTERKELSTNLLKSIQENGVGREPTPPEANPGKSFENGNFIKEYYLRVEEGAYQGVPLYEIDNFTRDEHNPLLIPAGSVYVLPVRKAKWSNSNYVDRGSRTEFLKGVVNINEFQDYIDERFTSGGKVPLSISAQLSNDCRPQPITKALVADLDDFQACGEAMEKDLGVNLVADRDELVLGDFFQSVYLGVRISYVTPMEQTASTNNIFTYTPPLHTPDSKCSRNHAIDPILNMYETKAATGFGSLPPFDNIAQTTAATPKSSLYQKAFFVPNGDNWAHVVPLVCSEVEIDPLTLMSDIANTGNRYTKADADGTPDAIDIGFFEQQFIHNYRSALIPQLTDSPEYKSLFRYLFPVDRMLSLNQIYSSEYLRSYKGVAESFDPTKIRLKDIFITLLNSGNYQSVKCTPSSLDLQGLSLNGIPWAGLAQQLIMMIAKTAVLIFKGFVEAYDINIAVSKMIRDSIHLVNQLIAQGQVMANTAQSLGAAVGDLQHLGSQQCKDPVPPSSPDEWFEPIDENFIPEPQIMWISLSLLPITLLPMFWPGLPITPFGLAYWGMDWVPEPMWLNSMPPSDWLDKLFNKEVKYANSIAGSPEACNIIDGLAPPSSDK